MTSWTLILSALIGVCRGDGFLTDLSKLVKVYTGTPKFYYEKMPLHPGCDDAFAFLFQVLGVPPGFDLLGMLGTSCPAPPTVPTPPPVFPEGGFNALSDNMSLHSDFQSETDSSLDGLIQTPAIDEEQGEAELARIKTAAKEEVSRLWSEVREQVQKEYEPTTLMEHFRAPYTGMEKGLRALELFGSKLPETEVLGPLLGQMVLQMVPPENIDPAVLEAMKSSRRLFVLGMVKFCITQTPDVVIGLLASKTVGNILSNLISNIFMRDFPTGSVGITIDGTFKRTNLGDRLCKSIDFSVDAKDFAPEWVVCALSNGLSAFLSCTSSPLNCPSIAESIVPPVQPPTCSYLHPDTHEEMHVPVMDMSLQPVAEGQDAMDLLPLDGPTLLYDYRATMMQSMFVSQVGCGLVDTTAPLFQIVPGWDRVAEVFLLETGSQYHVEQNRDYLVFTSVSRKPGECAFHITQRGTFNQFEWIVNFQAEMTPFGIPDGGVHHGYQTFAAQVMPQLNDFFSQHIGEGKECAPENTRIHVTGHSLGGGMAELYAYHLALRWADLGVALEATVWAPAHSLNKAAMDYTKARVNMRSVMEEFDIVPYFPCADKHGIPRCDSPKYPTFNGQGRDEPYSLHTNPIPLDIDELSAINPTYFEHYKLIIDVHVTLVPISMEMVMVETPSFLDFAVHHAEAYHCYFAYKFCDQQLEDSGCHNLATPSPTP
eukprot:Protomagalhaensia_sp_Gyna_25__4096@NODE_370_length_3667_cov_133_946251_g284_i0_p1_GENE_NODE_370_length_3667_cov_133_946251_g284_i0NODE_370_length_3667_cov_133_946251_g284_i0_p1_ORF_typecomplete_len710_score129_74Lipase_3/PF01764_25/2_8e19DUF2974/PF11187_8/9_9e05Hydrolase_4/PF12146_8/0_008Abhydrolase_6/PF12697_7/0_0096Esterase_phd/PF10503_9/0_013Abhydrolase_5/PF12695_7/0_017Chlorophyllase/PF07224_11/0_063Chlorophyllase2/PF12740_7/0_084DUF818/PF05677_12/0_18DUF676/PF05057_14/0_3AXE1/PF05448_12/0_2